MLCLPTIIGPCYCLGQVKTKFRVGNFISESLTGCAWVFQNLNNIPFKKTSKWYQRNEWGRLYRRLVLFLLHSESSPSSNWYWSETRWSWGEFRNLFLKTSISASKNEFKFGDSKPKTVKTFLGGFLAFILCVKYCDGKLPGAITFINVIWYDQCTDPAWPWMTSNDCKCPELAP